MNNDKNIKEFLKENENITVPETISSGIDSTLKEIKNKKNKKRKWHRYVTAASAAVLIIGLSVYNGDSVGAALNEAVGKMESFFGDRIKEDGFGDYKAVIGTTVEDNGLKVKLNEFLMEDDRVYMNVELDSENIGGQAYTIESSMSINGKKAELIGKTYTLNSTTFHTPGKKVSFLLEYGIKDIKMEDIKNIKINFHNATVKPNNVPRSGKWQFAFNYDGKKMAKATAERKVNKDIMIGNVKVHVDTIKVTPISTVVKYKVTGNSGKRLVNIGVLDKGGNVETGENIGGENGDITTKAWIDSKGLDKAVLVPYFNYIADDEPRKDEEFFKDKAITIDLK